MQCGRGCYMLHAACCPRLLTPSWHCPPVLHRLPACCACRPLNLDTLQMWVAQGRLPTDRVITMRVGGWVGGCMFGRERLKAHCCAGCWRVGSVQLAQRSVGVLTHGVAPLGHAALAAAAGVCLHCPCTNAALLCTICPTSLLLPAGPAPVWLLCPLPPG